MRRWSDDGGRQGSTRTEPQQKNTTATSFAMDGPLAMSMNGRKYIRNQRRTAKNKPRPPFTPLPRPQNTTECPAWEDRIKAQNAACQVQMHTSAWAWWRRHVVAVDLRLGFCSGRDQTAQPRATTLSKIAPSNQTTARAASAMQRVFRAGLACRLRHSNPRIPCFRSTSVVGCRARPGSRRFGATRAGATVFFSLFLSLPPTVLAAA